MKTLTLWTDTQVQWEAEVLVRSLGLEPSKAIRVAGWHSGDRMEGFQFSRTGLIVLCHLPVV